MIFSGFQALKGLFLGQKWHFLHENFFFEFLVAETFFIRKSCKMMCFFEKLAMWYPRNDTYPEFGPQRSTRKGSFFPLQSNKPPQTYLVSGSGQYYQKKYQNMFIQSISRPQHGGFLKNVLEMILRKIEFWQFYDF